MSFMGAASARQQPWTGGLSTSTRSRFVLVLSLGSFLVGLTMIVLGQSGGPIQQATEPPFVIYSYPPTEYRTEQQHATISVQLSDSFTNIVDTTVVDKPSSIIMTEDRRLNRIKATAIEDFPQLQRSSFLNDVERITKELEANRQDIKVLHTYHPSLVAWASTRYHVAKVPHGEEAASANSKAFMTKYLRYPNGPPSLYQFYDSPTEVNKLYRAFGSWLTAPNAKEEWGRWDPSVTTQSFASVTPPTLDYAHLACPSTAGELISTHTLATLLGKTRISLVVEEPLRCIDFLTNKISSPRKPSVGPSPEKEHMVGGLASNQVAPLAVEPAKGAKAERRQAINKWLFVHAPSWYVHQLDMADDGVALARMCLRRRVKAFHFAVTGGSDKRASYVEHTWGQRTPLLWFGDSWVPSIRPLLSASQHPKYAADRFGLLSFKMSRVWEVVYRDFFCSTYSAAYSANAMRAVTSKSGKEGHTFDATYDPLSYDDQVGDRFVPLPPDRCPSTIEINSEAILRPHSEKQALYSRLARFGARKVLVAMHAAAPSYPSLSAANTPYEWYIRLWDDNYYFEENLYNIVGRVDSDAAKVMLGKIGWRNMGANAVYPFAGGGAGWFLSKAGMAVVGPSFAPPLSSSEEGMSPPSYSTTGLNPELSGEEWFKAFRDRKDIFMKHGLHNEDVFLTAWFAINNVTMWNVPGVEHVSPGMWPKQRCMSDLALFKLRWEGWAAGGEAKLPFAGADHDPTSDTHTFTSLFYDYPVSDPTFLLEDQPHSYGKPLVWHYMSPTRLVGLERALYAEAVGGTSDPQFKPIWGPPAPQLPKTASDKGPSFAKLRKGKSCYAGVPQVTREPGGQWERKVPAPGSSIFEQLLPDPPLA